MPIHASPPPSLEKKIMQMPEGIAVIYPEELKPGVVGDLFNKGIKAVIVKDPRILKIWDGLLGCQDTAGEIKNFSSTHRMPWQENLFSIARNHVSNDEYLGDMIRFSPGHYGHIARKMKIFPVADGSSIQAIPGFFFQGGRQFSYPDSLLESIWELMSQLFKGTLPNNSFPPPYAVKIDLLKYPDPIALNKTFSLLSDSCVSGGWSRIGQKIDAHRGMAKGVFKRRFLRHLFGLGLLVPGINLLLRKLNNILSKQTDDPIFNDWLMIGEEHVDGTKFLTGLASERDILKTQVYIGESWVDLPLTPDSLTIFPSHKITKKFGFSPTRHRILMKRTPLIVGEPKQNVTISLGIVDR